MQHLGSTLATAHCSKQKVRQLVAASETKERMVIKRKGETLAK